MMPGSPFNDLQSILAIRLDNVGDVVMLGPALRALREAYPAARMTLMASPAGSQVAPLLPWVDEVLTWRAVWQDINKEAPIQPEKEQELVRILAEHAFDAAFIFTSFSQSPHPPAYACYLARIPVRVGQSKEFGGALLSHWVKPPHDEGYQVERNLHLLREVGFPIHSDRLELRVPAGDQQNADRLLEAAGIQSDAAFIVAAPGASAAARRYDPDRMAQAIAQLARQSGLPVVVIGSPREVGKFPAIESLAESHPRIISLLGQTSVVEMAAVIRRSALLIGNNSGSMHMAAAFNRPMVILYSGTEVFEQWTPHQETLRLLNRPVACSPCYAFQCPYHMECLDIPAEEVAATALSLLKADVSSPSNLANGLARTDRR